MTGTGSNEHRSLSKLALKHPLPVFFVLAYVLSWFVFVPMIAFHAPVQFTILASFGPCAAAIITHYLRTKNWRAFRLIGSLRRSAAAACAGVVLTVLAYVVLPALVTANPSKLHWSILISPTVYNYSTFVRWPFRGRIRLAWVCSPQTGSPVWSDSRMCCARHILGRLAPSLILRAGVDVVAVLDLCADRHQPFFDYWVCYQCCTICSCSGHRHARHV